MNQLVLYCTGSYLSILQTKSIDFEYSLKVLYSAKSKVTSVMVLLKSEFQDPLNVRKTE